MTEYKFNLNCRAKPMGVFSMATLKDEITATKSLKIEKLSVSSSLGSIESTRIKQWTLNDM